MTTVFFLHHLEEPRADGFQDYKQIGIYSTEAKAQHAIERRRDQPGFRDRSNDWRIRPQILDQGSWENGFAKDTHKPL